MVYSSSDMDGAPPISTRYLLKREQESRSGAKQNHLVINGSNEAIGRRNDSGLMEYPNHKK